MKANTQKAIEQYLASIKGLNLSPEIQTAGIKAIIAGLEGK